LKRFLPLIIFGVLSIFLVIGLQLNPKDIPSPLIGKSAPTFQLPALNQAQTEFSPKQMLGKVWLLNVWASWCVSCREEHPLLLELAKKNSIPIVGLNYKDKNAPAIEWLIKMGDPYSLSVVDADGTVGINYGVYGVPETFLINQQGVIVHKFTGPLTINTLQKDLPALLAKLKS
jgi:cytochrome c biogenesis protein CcmG, thiol:disulfide interchange protein DsbE